MLELLFAPDGGKMVDPYSGNHEAPELKAMFRQLLQRALWLLKDGPAQRRQQLLAGAMMSMGECLMSKVRVVQQLLMQLQHVAGSFDQVVVAMAEEYKQSLVAR